MRIRLETAKAVLGLTSNSALAAILPVNEVTGKPVNKSTVGRWGEFIPELQCHRLLALKPELRDHVIKPETGLTLAEMTELCEKVKQGG